MKTKQDVAQTGVKAQGGIDGSLTMARTNSLELEAVVERGVELGMVKAIQGKRMINDARKLTGMIAAAAAFAAEIHAEQTAVCKSNDCDTGVISTVAGVDLPEATVKSGGR